MGKPGFQDAIDLIHSVLGAPGFPALLDFSPVEPDGWQLNIHPEFTGRLESISPDEADRLLKHPAVEAIEYEQGPKASL